MNTNYPGRPLLLHPAQWGLLASLLLGFGLRLYRLGADSLWYDEGVSVYLAGLPLPQMIAHTAGDIHPPLYYALLHLWSLLAGRSEFAVAFFSLFWGLVLVALTYRVGADLLSPQVGLLAAFLASISPFHVWYSQEVRMYTLGASLGLLATWCLAGMLEGRKPRWRWWVSYVVTATTGIYTLYYFAFLLAFQNIFVVAYAFMVSRRAHSGLQAGDKGLLLPWLLAQGAVLLLYLPWLPIAYRQATQPPVPPWRSFVSLPEMVQESWTTLSLGQSASASWAWPAMALSAGAYILPLAYAIRRGTGVERQRVFLLAGHTLVPWGLLLLLSLLTPLYHVRYLFTYAAAFYIVVAGGLARLARRPQLLAAALLLLSLGSAASLRAYYHDPAFIADDHRAAVRFLADRWRPGDAIVINAGYVYPVVLYYYQGDIAWRGRLRDYMAPPATPGAVLLQTGSIGGSPQLGWGNPASDFYATTEEEMTRALDRVARLHPRLWVYRCYDTVTDPQGVLRRYLEEQFRKLEDVGFAGSSYVRVQLYQSPYRPVSGLSPLSYDFGGLVRLIGYRLEGQAQSGSRLYLTMLWQGQQPLADDFGAFVTLRRGTRLVAQWDAQPVGSLLPSSRWPVGEALLDPWRLDLPLGLPPGEYSLAVGLYRRSDGQRLSILGQDGHPLGTEAPLGTVNLSKADLPVDTAKLPIKERVFANLGDEVDLLGYSLSERRLTAGHTLQVTIFWRARRALAEDYTVFIQLLDEGGKPWAATDVRPWQGDYPTLRWQAGEVVRDTYDLTLAANAPEGTYRLIAGLYRSKDKRRLPLTGLFQSGDAVSLGTVQGASRQRVFAVPAIQHQLQARLGDGVTLLGYDLDMSEEALTVTLYWRCLQDLSVSYTVFVHLVDEDGRIVSQHDGIPGQGGAPTTGWLPGEVLADRHVIPLKGMKLSGTYRLVSGMYDAVTGQRLPVRDESGALIGDMVVLGTVSP